MKDYDEEVEIERAKTVIEEEQKRRFEVRIDTRKTTFILYCSYL
jgi:hypothetical protein